eukprot:TRINITY_DN1517_c0_g1_i1.p1 TRINITY_DN1517_c0_g1~~TRINITY_DN1517_c0_g1_i1.p1  ORF type:complete len:149 (+),score=17.44 TRINITY_DN1517_c0_g1_i1:64-510(+)
MFARSVIVLMLATLGGAARTLRHIAGKNASRVEVETLTAPNSSKAEPKNLTTAKMTLEPMRFMEVRLGSFSNTEEACNACFTSFTKQGVPPAGPVETSCTCYAYTGDSGVDMFCATPTSAAKFVASKSGCACVARDMQAMGKTTCTPL